MLYLPPNHLTVLFWFLDSSEINCNNYERTIDKEMMKNFIIRETELKHFNGLFTDYLKLLWS